MGILTFRADVFIRLGDSTVAATGLTLCEPADQFSAALSGCLSRRVALMPTRLLRKAGQGAKRPGRC